MIKPIVKELMFIRQLEKREVPDDKQMFIRKLSGRRRTLFLERWDSLYKASALRYYLKHFSRRWIDYPCLTKIVSRVEECNERTVKFKVEKYFNVRTKLFRVEDKIIRKLYIGDMITKSNIYSTK